MAWFNLLANSNRISQTKKKTFQNQVQLLSNHLEEVCDRGGYETDTEKSSEIFRELALQCKTLSPHKQNLVCAAIFLSAAIKRRPGCTIYIKDFEDLWKYVLVCAKAHRTDISISAIQQKVKQEVADMRNMVKDDLKRFQKILPMHSSMEERKLKKQNITCIYDCQDRLTHRYRKIMEFIAAKCAEIMGKPPCKYALLGTGTLALGEITPYSEFENMIMIKTEEKIRKIFTQYFGWFAALFHIIIISLNETPVFEYLLSGEKDKCKPVYFCDTTIRGLCFMNALQIKKPTSLNKKHNIIPEYTGIVSMMKMKANISIANSMPCHCFVAGDLALYDEICLFFANAAKQHDFRSAASNDILNFDSLNSFGSVSTVPSSKLKQIVYHTANAYVRFLGRINGTTRRWCKDVISDLKQRKITEYIVLNLSFVVAYSSYVRLASCLKKDGADDFDKKDIYYALQENDITVFLFSMIGEKSLVNFMEIVLSMHEIIKIFFKKNKNTTQELTKNLDLSWKFRILYFLKLSNVTLQEWNRYTKAESSRLLIPLQKELWIMFYAAAAYYNLKRYESALMMLKEIGRRNTNPYLRQNVSILKILTNFALKNYKTVTESIVAVKSQIKDLALVNVVQVDRLATLCNIAGRCLLQQRKYKEALRAFEEQMSYIGCIHIPDRNIGKAICLTYIGRCYMLLYQSEKATSPLTEASKSLKEIGAPVSWLCTCYRLLGQCYKDLFKYQEAQQVFQTELDLRCRHVPKEKQYFDKDIQLAKKELEKLKLQYMCK